MMLRSNGARRYPARRRASSANVRVVGEALEKRLLLSINEGLTIIETPHEQADAQHAAQIDFDGPDMVGKDGPMAKIGFDLDLLFEEQKIHDVLHAGTTFTPSNSLLVVSGGKVLVDVVAKGSVATFQAQVAALGMNVTATAGSLVEGMISVTALNQLASLGGLDFGRPSYKPATTTGSVESQGDVALKADLARAQFGVDGTGQTVGILSDSFDSIPYPGGVDGVKRDISTGDLPQQTTILQDSPSGEDEGRAMGQIVHDVAPGAAIQFATANGGEANFAANIQKLAAAGSNIIVDDVAYLTEPFFQDGIVAQAVNTVVASGNAYFSAAGNEGVASYESPFVDSGVAGLRGGKLHDFDPGSGVSTLQQINLPLGANFTPGFQWDQPFKSLGGAGSASDLDIYVIGADGTTVLGSSTVNNLGGDPLELFRFINNGSFDLDHDNVPDTKFFVRIELVSGPAPGLMKYVDFGRETTIVTFATDSSTDVGHSNAASALGVAASAFFFTPAFGQTPPVLNTFSSNGGTETLFDPTGNRLPAPILHGSPQVTGVDGANTTFFGQDVPQDTDSLPNFFGTSAAAPHVAAVAALLLQAGGGRGSLTPQTIYTTLENSGIDIVSREDVFTPGAIIPITNGTGVDSFSGHGLVNAFQAVQATESRVSIGSDVTMLEGSSGFTNFVFTVTLGGVVALPVTVSYTTIDGTATAPSDYVAQSGVLTFQPGGPATLPIIVQVRGDTAVELNETFFVRITNVVNSIAGRAQATGTIINDDDDITINDVTVIEGDPGKPNAVFTISANGAVSQPITVSWTTVDVTAGAGSDYVPRNGTVTFPPSGGSATISIPILDDQLNESTETFDVVLYNPTIGRLAKPIGVGTILDNDLTPTFYVNDVHVTTTQTDQLAAVFTVALDRRSGQFVTVEFATSNGTAADGVNYTGTSGTLAFAPGVTSQLVTVPVMTSSVYSPNEQFYLNLSNPLHATLTDPQGTATIIFAAPLSTESIVDDGGPGFSQTPGWVNVTNTLAYQLDYDYHTAGGGGDTATWTFNNLANGTYQVLARWIGFSNRATNAPYTVLDGSTSLGTVLVNQQQMPVGDQSNGITWQSLGKFNTTTGTLAVRLGDNANGYVIADAIRIVANGIPPQVPEMDLAGSGRSILSGSNPPSFDNGTDFGGVRAATNSEVQPFTITNTGNADLHLTGAPRVAISGANFQDFTVLTQPASTIAAGASSTFQVMFHPSDVGTRSATMTIANDDADENPYTIKLQGTGAAAGPSQLVIDDSTGGFGVTGGFATNNNTQADLGELRSDAPGSGGDRAMWNFTGLAPGNYTVYTTWVPFFNRATNAPYTIADGNVSQSTVLVNQQLTPADVSYSGMMWKSLETLHLTSGTLSVSLGNQANGFVIADAVYLVRNDMPVIAAASTTTPPSYVPPASPNWAHNVAMPLDVDGNGVISARDALIIIDYMLAPGAAPLSATSSFSPAHFNMDVSGDGAVSPIDLLMVIDYLLVPTPHATAASASASVVAASVAAVPPASPPSNSSTALAAIAVDQAISQFGGTQPSASGQQASPMATAPPLATPPSTSQLTLVAVQAYFSASATTSESLLDPLDD